MRSVRPVGRVARRLLRRTTADTVSGNVVVVRDYAEKS